MCPEPSHGAEGELTSASMRVAGSAPRKPGFTAVPGVKGEIALTHWALGWLPGPPSLKVIKIIPTLPEAGQVCKTLSHRIIENLGCPLSASRGPAGACLAPIQQFCLPGVWRVAG